MFWIEGMIDNSFPSIPANGLPAASTILIERLLEDHFAMLVSNAGVTVIIYFCKNASLFLTPVEYTIFVAGIFADGVAVVVVVVGFVATVVGLLVVVVAGFVTVVVSGFVTVVVAGLVAGLVVVFMVVVEDALFVAVVLLVVVVGVFVLVVATGGVGNSGTITLFVDCVVATVVFVVAGVVHLFMRASVAVMFPFVSTNAIGSNVLLNR